MEYTQTPDELVTSMAELIADELALPYVLIEIEHAAWGEGRAEHGAPVGRELALPLTYQGYPAGRLVVSGRRPREAVGRRDRRVLGGIAPPGGGGAGTPPPPPRPPGGAGPGGLPPGGGGGRRGAPAPRSGGPPPPPASP